MRKEDITSAVIYLVLIAAAIITGCTVVEDAFRNYSKAFMNPYLFGIFTILLAVLFNVVLLEAFHCIGAFIGGYKVVQFNVLGFNFEKINGKWEFHFKDFNGLTGETTVVPIKEKTSMKPYIWMPVLGYLLELIVGISVYSIFQDTSLTGGVSIGWLGVGALLFIILSSMIALYNLVPLKLDSLTDGYRLVALNSKENFEAFNEVSRVRGLQREGKEVKGVKTFTNITDFTAEANLEAVYALIGDNKLKEAEVIIDSTLVEKDKISKELFARFTAQKIYILNLTKDKKEVKEYYKNVTDEIRRFIANDKTLETLRSYILIAKNLDESESEIELIKVRKERLLKNALPTRREIESKLINQLLK